MTSWHPCSLPELPPILPEGKVTLFFPEFQPKLPVQPGWSPFTSSFFGTQGQPFPVPLGFPYWKMSSLPDFFTLQDCLPRDSVNQAPNVRLKKFKVAVLLTPLSYSLGIKNCIISWFLCPRCFQPSHHPQALLCSQTTGPVRYIP